MTPTTIEFLEKEIVRGRAFVAENQRELELLERQRDEMTAKADAVLEPLRAKLAERCRKLAEIEQDLEEGRNPPSMIVSHGTPDTK